MDVDLLLKMEGNPDNRTTEEADVVDEAETEGRSMDLLFQMGSSSLD